MRKRSLLLELKLIALTVARIPKEFSSGPFSAKPPSQPRASLPDAPASSGTGERLYGDKAKSHTNGRMHFAVSRVTLAIERSYPETLIFSMVRQMLQYAQPLVKP